jgi:hypothetical protein
MVLLVGLLIVKDYRYDTPLMSRLESSNAAYETIKNTKEIVFNIPFQINASHHSHSTYLYYAQKYNLRMFIGNSSMYPKEWDNIIFDFESINDGRFDKDLRALFRKHGIKYLIAHAAEYEPKVDLIVIEKLKQSPFLHLMADDAGIYIFEVDYDATGNLELNSEALLRSLPQSYKDKIIYFDGWHMREDYPGQRAYRWMNNTQSDVLLLDEKPSTTIIEFDYKCPDGDLEVLVNQKRPAVLKIPEDDYWVKMYIDLSSIKNLDPHLHLQFSTPRIYAVQNDTRKFGCEIGDISLRKNLEVLNRLSGASADNSQKATGSLIPQPLTISGFKAKIEPQLSDIVVGKGEDATVPIKITNISDSPWSRDGKNGGWGFLSVALSYHVMNKNGDMIVLEGKRTLLTGNLMSNQTVLLDAQIEAPTKTGEYIYLFDMVQEGISWFERKGSSTAKIHVSVK